MPAKSKAQYRAAASRCHGSGKVMKSMSVKQACEMARATKSVKSLPERKSSRKGY